MSVCEVLERSQSRAHVMASASAEWDCFCNVPAHCGRVGLVYVWLEWYP